MYVVSWMYVTRWCFGMVLPGKFVFRLYEVVFQVMLDCRIFSIVIIITIGTFWGEGHSCCW